MPSENVDIQLFNESDIDIPVDTDLVTNTAGLIADQENCTFVLLEIVYVDEEEIIRINTEYLDRSYVTDIITFRYDEDDNNTAVEGTVFCCAPKIQEQAAEFGQEPQTEYMRILIHGLLHLVGYNDQTEPEKEQMTKLENHYLKLIQNT